MRVRKVEEYPHIGGESFNIFDYREELGIREGLKIFC
jgi:hypothetical protein